MRKFVFGQVILTALLFALLTLFEQGSAKAATVLPASLTEVDSGITGTLLDMDSDRYLIFRETEHKLVVMDRSSKSVTTVFEEQGLNIRKAQLHDFGVVFRSESRAYDWRNGQLIDLGALSSSTGFDIAGQYAALYIGDSILLRDLSTGTSKVISDSRILKEVRDLHVNESGNVAYLGTEQDGSGKLFVYRDGQNAVSYEYITSLWPVVIDDYVIYVRKAVWEAPVNGLTRYILLSKKSSNMLVAELGKYSSYPTTNLAHDKGWIGFTTTNLQGVREIVIRSKAGGIKTVATLQQEHRLLSMGNNGGIAYQDGNAAFLGRYGSDNVLRVTENYSSNHGGPAIFPYDGKWYYYHSSEGKLFEIDTTPIAPAPGHVFVEGISLSPSELDLIYGQSVQLVATITPSQATDKRIVWTSSTRTVSVDEQGNVTTNVKYHHSARITATTVDGGLFAETFINVNPEPAVTLSDEKVIMSTLYNKKQLSATVTPSGYKLKWSSLDPTIATVDQTGLVTALRPGTTTITVATEDGRGQDTCLIEITEPLQVQAIYINTFQPEGYFTGVVDSVYKTITFTLPKQMENSNQTKVSLFSAQASPGTEEMNITAGPLSFSYTTWGNGWFEYPHGQVTVCECQKFLSKFDKFTFELFDKQGNKYTYVYTVRLRFE
ncbi:Ig-like domain-containing protein [Paenibacillus flagellatus]|uniref:BIG2 domain-containing protein n=1 Tax=Paenibacillus flagellatus TaxID=2211139 RepID=A0A2V5K5I5_9BACL|nr:Ig-like domain-containing protein [Paenibacillus flagellatus]PYI54012.1 hypothetical protein DLM86_15810 [Paenibacillus flagellatus]